MKFFLIFNLLCSFLFGGNFEREYNYETSYELALQKAKEANKNIVMVLVSSHCPWCESLKEEVLSLEYTNELVHKNYIPLMVHGGDNIPSKFHSYVVPTIHFIDSHKETLIESVYGFNNNYRFYEIIEGSK